MLTVHHADVLSNPADALILTFDGTFRPAGDLERTLGNIARQFLRRFPEVDLLDCIEGQVDFPVPLGEAVAVELDGPPFPLVILASTLHHLHSLDESARRAVARQSFSAALRLCGLRKSPVVATPILQGGWRLPPLVALAAMLQATEVSRADLDVRLCVSDTRLAEEATVLARSLGFGSPLSHEGPKR